jgi:hypothetical protein
MASTTIDAEIGDPEKREQTRVIELTLIAAGNLGLTREEIFERTGIKVPSVCWRVSEMLRDGLAFERTLGGKFVLRNRAKVVAHVNYAAAR